MCHLYLAVGFPREQCYDCTWMLFCPIRFAVEPEDAPSLEQPLSPAPQQAAIPAPVVKATKPPKEKPKAPKAQQQEPRVSLTQSSTPLVFMASQPPPAAVPKRRGRPPKNVWAGKVYATHVSRLPETTLNDPLSRLHGNITSIAEGTRYCEGADSHPDDARATRRRAQSRA